MSGTGDAGVQNPQAPWRRALRVKTGCLTCRRRRKKCDEKSPVCGGCSRNALSCEWETGRNGSSRPQDLRRGVSKSSNGNESSGSPSQSPSPTGNSSELQIVISSRQNASFNAPWQDLDNDASDWSNMSIYQPLLSRAQTVGNSMDAELLTYYLTDFSVVIANGATAVNPFTAQLIPLAFTDPLMLQLLLAQAATHRAEAASFRAPLAMQVHMRAANSYYSRALRAFRDALDGYIVGDKERLIILAIGSLTLCFTELTHGDIQGASFSHLRAAKSLLIDLMASTPDLVPNKLMSFIVEYYLYNATLSMLSLNIADQPHVDPRLLKAGTDLVSENYIGQLCGCWLPLLMQIPDIVNLKRQIDSGINGGNGLSADAVVKFALLKEQIARYEPSANLQHTVALAGRIYQQTVMLYLLTTLGSPDPSEGGAHQIAIQEAVGQALSHLRLLSPLARINTNLLWPLCVLGSCLTDDDTRAPVRTHLKSMSNKFGIGTMRETLYLLEYMWGNNGRHHGPWSMWKVMHERQVYLSFA